MTRIPKTLHYIFGMAPNFGGKPWSMIHHVCLKSAVERIKPDSVFLYYQYAPKGPWWELSKPLVRAIKIKAPTQIFGHPLVHVAHRADVVRLQKLIEHGGIYLDADVLVQRDFDDLLEFPAVLGQEGEHGSWGIANAVILAEPGSKFLIRWLEEYKTFRSRGRDEFWSEHSVHLPSELAREYPEEVRVLSHKAFFWPLWTNDHLEWIFKSDHPIPLDLTYANHLWETPGWKYVEGLTPGVLRKTPSNFRKWAMPFLLSLPDDYGALTIVGRARERLVRYINKVRNVKYEMLAKAEGLKRRVSHRCMNPSETRKEVFSKVYSQKLWGGDNYSKFFSGIGSRGRALEDYAENMAIILLELTANLGRPITIIDLGCGDFQVGRAMVEKLPDCSYVGCDIVPELIIHNQRNYGSERVRFQNLDIVTDDLPAGDVCLVRQVLQHLSNADISTFLNRQLYSLLYVTEGQPTKRMGRPNPDKVASAEVRFDWRTGRGRGVELDQPPFNLVAEEVFRAFAPPHELIITQRISRCL